jgi:hypothetical protein
VQIQQAGDSDSRRWPGRSISADLVTDQAGWSAYHTPANLLPCIAAIKTSGQFFLDQHVNFGQYVYETIFLIMERGQSFKWS